MLILLGTASSYHTVDQNQHLPSSSVILVVTTTVVFHNIITALGYVKKWL